MLSLRKKVETKPESVVGKNILDMFGNCLNEFTNE